MAKLPRPRLPLPALTPSAFATLRKGTRIWRVYRTASRHPASWDALRHFGPVAVGRFDHQAPPPHDDPDRGILYGSADHGDAAIVEAFQDTRLIDRVLDSPWLVAFELTRDVTALDLRGPWTTLAGASQAIASGRRDTAQAWSRAIYEAYPTVAALLYPSAMAGRATNVAVYERAGDALPKQPLIHVPLAHPGLEASLNRIATTFGYDLR